MIILEKQIFKKVLDNNKIKRPVIKNVIKAFLVGGFVGLLGEGIIEILILCFHMSRSDSATFMIMIMIFVLIE